MFHNQVFLLLALPFPSVASSLRQQEEYGKGDSTFEINSRFKSRSLLLDKPGLLSTYSSGKHFAPQKGAYDFNEQYQAFDGDRTRKTQAKVDAAQFNSKFYSKENIENDNSNRGLFTTGHLAGVILDDCSAEEVYRFTDYDDGYQPICSCVFYEEINEVVMECYLGDENCSVPEQGTIDDAICIGTHELFFFSDDDGDLSNKLTCVVCRSENCDGINEICTEVAFNSDNAPDACQLIKLPPDGLDGVEVCAECDICDDNDGNKGVEHTCFESPTNGCTESYATAHNFESETDGGGPPIGGLFGDVCALTSPDAVLYSHVSYHANYSTLCNCDDPSSGAVECDLYDDACHANLCTDISELFFFDEETGDYEAKWTINWNTGLWTQVLFDSATGAATSCSVFGNDRSSGELLECTTCKICNSADEKGGGRPGIAYDCFDFPQSTECDISEGRAAFNFETASGALSIQQSESKTTANGSQKRDRLQPWMSTWP